MAINFPNNPSTNDIFNANGVSYIYDGDKWVGVSDSSGAGAVNGSFYESFIDIVSDYTVASGKNSMVAGPITVNDGVTITIPDGSTLIVV